MTRLTRRRRLDRASARSVHTAIRDAVTPARAVPFNSCERPAVLIPTVGLHGTCRCGPVRFSSFGPTRWIFAFAFAFALTFTWIASPARPSPASARGSLRRPGHRPFRQPARVPTPTVAEHRPAPDQDPPRQRHRRLLAPRLLTLAQSLEDGLAVRVVPQHPPRHLQHQLPEPPAPGPADPPDAVT